MQIVVEQPLSSSMFKLPIWEEMINAQNLATVLTYMGAYGHFMVKGTHLLGNLHNLSWFFRAAIYDSFFVFNCVRALRICVLYIFGCKILDIVRMMYDVNDIQCDVFFVIRKSLRLQRSLTPKIRKKVEKAKHAMEQKLGRKLEVYKISGKTRPMFFLNVFLFFDGC